MLANTETMFNHILTNSIPFERRFLSFAFAFLFSAVSANASADDTEIYDRIANVPKVLFVLDASGSMNFVDRGYVGTRLQRMKQALDLLINSVKGVDVGLMKFAGNSAQLIHPIVEVQDNRGPLGVAAQGITAGGGTPTIAALVAARNYFRGPQSPTSNQCETNHIVLLTDGVPTVDSGEIARLEGFLGGCAAVQGRPAAKCGIELADYLATTDQLPHVPGENHISTHAIGFNLEDNWLPQVPAGEGSYSDAASAQDLLAVFEEILEEVQLTATVAAPTVSANAFSETRHSDELYYSFFQPARRPRWNGNVKKYRLLNGEIVDADDSPLLVDGMVSLTSRSLWADSADGAEVASGGMAARQPADRRWYTDFGLTPAANGKTTPLLVTGAASLTNAAVGAATDAEREAIVGWVRGADSIDADNDGDLAEPNHFVADALHNSPVLVSYNGKESDDTLNEVVFSANNMGVVHAVNAESGDELWSYSPAELLPNIKHYIDNSNESHVYGLDGSMVVHTKNKTTTSYDFELDKAWLYLTQRRGGNNIFALDVSNAMAASDPFKVMWRINGGVAGTDFRDLGQTWSTPQIVPVRYGCPDACESKKVLLFSGGYNTIYDDTDLSYPVTPAPAGHGNAIYIVDPETGELIWSAGNGAHHSLHLPINDSVPATPVPVDTDADGNVNVLFFSDIAGHVWRVDLDQNAGNARDLAIDGGMIADLNEPGQKLRFFNRVDVVVNGTTFGTAKFNLVLGTGMRSSPLFTEAHNNRVFSFQDPWVYTNPVSADASTGELEPDYRYVVKTDGSREVITPSILWDFDLNDTTLPRVFGFYKRFSRGEKVLQPTLTHGGRVFLTAYTPPASGDSCNYLIGESRLYVLDLNTGENLLPSRFGDSAPVGSGIVTNVSIFDNGDSGGENLMSGPLVTPLSDLTGSENVNVFRRFFRTGWVERDD